jgi:hypothetical protein
MKEISLDQLIKSLQDARARGGKTVKYKGTILVPETGNEIIISSDPQF